MAEQESGEDLESPQERPTAASISAKDSPLHGHFDVQAIRIRRLFYEVERGEAGLLLGFFRLAFFAMSDLRVVCNRAGAIGSS